VIDLGHSCGSVRRAGRDIAGEDRVVTRPGSPVVVDELSRRRVPNELWALWMNGAVGD
jgi:hypothetical protein